MKTSWKPLRRSSEKRAAEFNRGRESVEDNGWSSNPKHATTYENVKVVHTLLMCDRRQDLRRIVREVGIRLGEVQSILTDILGMTKVSARWVPQMLIDDQKRTRLDISKCPMSCYKNDSSDFY